MDARRVEFLKEAGIPSVRKILLPACPFRRTNPCNINAATSLCTFHAVSRTLIDGE